MDDFIILLKNKDECKYYLNKIEKFINSKLNLELNNKSRYYPNKFGSNFCGYIIFEDYKILRKRSKTKIKKKIKLWNKLYKLDKLDFNKMKMGWNSWLGHAYHCNSYNLRLKLYNSILAKSYLDYY